MKEFFDIAKTHPTVFAVGCEYQIIVPVKCPSLMSVIVDGIEYPDESGGVLRSNVAVHKVSVPMKSLDTARAYTLVFRSVIDRKPYFPEFESAVTREYAFRPLESERLGIYHISDTHNLEEAPIAAGRAFADQTDLLVLNGDIPDHSGSAENFDTIYKIASELLHGEKPCIFSRGNHDLRGALAESFGEYTPEQDGRSYYTFRCGPLWGIVLDCGEDKDDSFPEYGGTVAFHSFRLRQTEFIRQVIENAAREYEAEGVKYRLVISHVPFSYKQEPPFDIEGELYREWCTLLRTHIKPTFMLSGHLHATKVFMQHDKFDSYGAPCPVVIGSDLRRANPAKQMNEGFCGAFVGLSPENIRVVFNDSEGGVKGEFTL